MSEIELSTMFYRDPAYAKAAKLIGTTVFDLRGKLITLLMFAVECGTFPDLKITERELTLKLGLRGSSARWFLKLTLEEVDGDFYRIRDEFARWVVYRGEVKGAQLNQTLTLSPSPHPSPSLLVSPLNVNKTELTKEERDRSYSVRSSVNPVQGLLEQFAKFDPAKTLASDPACVGPVLRLVDKQPFRYPRKLVQEVLQDFPQLKWQDAEDVLTNMGDYDPAYWSKRARRSMKRTLRNWLKNHRPSQARHERKLSAVEALLSAPPLLSDAQSERPTANVD